MGRGASAHFSSLGRGVGAAAAAAARAAGGAEEVWWARAALFARWGQECEGASAQTSAFRQRAVQTLGTA
ncbi:PE domain-containing protein [Mycobacterium tuberculosis]|nr:PE domain-containing protein [Mycobacterium tuberculosis]